MNIQRYTQEQAQAQEQAQEEPTTLNTNFSNTIVGKNSEKDNFQSNKSPSQKQNIKLNNSFMRPKSHRTQQRVETFENVMERLSMNIKVSPSKRKNRYL